MRMLTESSITENKLRSTSIERFRNGQSKKNIHLSQTEVGTTVTWPNILKHIGFYLAAGSFFLFIIFSLSFLSLIF